MNRLTLGALTALAATQIAGCIITSDNDVDRYITVNWQLKNVGSDLLQPCPAGYDTIAFYSQETDANGNPFGEQFLDYFPCIVGTARSAPLPPSTYLSWIQIVDFNHTATYAQSVAAHVDTRSGDQRFDAAIFYNGGYFKIDWDLVGASSGAQLQCGTAGVTDVDVLATLVTTSALTEFPPVPCEDYSAITPVLPAGPYSVVLEALNPGDILGTIDLPTQSIEGYNRITRLRNPPYDIISIPIDGR